MKYQIGEVVRFIEDVPYSGAFRLGGGLATITDAKQYGNYGDGTLAPGPVYKTAITGDTWVHQDYLVPVNGGMKPVGESASGSQSAYQLGEVIRFADTPRNREKLLRGKLATLIAVDHGDPETYQTAITACDEWFGAEAFEPVNGGMPRPEEESISVAFRVFVPGQKIRVRDDLVRWEDTTSSDTGYCVTAAMLQLAGQTVTVADWDGKIIHIAELDNHAWLPDMFIQPLADGEKAVKESNSDSTGDETDFETVTRLISDLDSCDYDCLIDWLRNETDRRNNAEHDTLLVDLGVALNRCLDSKLFSFLEQESLNELSKIYENDLDPSVRE